MVIKQLRPFLLQVLLYVLLWCEGESFIEWFLHGITITLITA